MRVCIENSTGLLISSQSGDGAIFGTLVANAVRAGYAKGDVTESVVTEDAAKTLMDAASEAVKTYADHRREAYGSIVDQIDMQYWDAVNGTTVWNDHVAAIKAAHPKD